MYSTTSAICQITYQAIGSLFRTVICCADFSTHNCYGILELAASVVTSLHLIRTLDGWWRTIKEVEPTGEGTHNQSTTSVLAHHKATSNPTTPHFSFRLHHGLWVLLGVHVLEITTQCTHAMHTCTMHMNYSTDQDMQVYPCPS